MRRHTTFLVLGVLVASACSGPREPLSVGVREVPNNIVLADAPESEPAGMAPIPPAPVKVPIVTAAPIPAPPRFAPEPSPPPAPPVEQCPRANPLDVPAEGVTDGFATPPVEESFRFRNDGEFTVSGPNANEGTFTEPTARVIQAVELQDDGDFTYDVGASLGGTVTTSSYLVRHTERLDDGLGIGDQAGLDEQRGLYLTAVNSRLPDDRVVTFQPADPLRLLRFPVFVGDTFDVAGADPFTATSMSYTVTVTDRVRVDACGELIDAWRVSLTNGRVDGPNTNVEFVATYDIATQYGGLIVRDTVVTSGREGLDTIVRTNTATISSVPAFFGPFDPTGGGGG